MQMSALEEHNNSLLHKEALRLQMASKDKGLPAVERPVFVKGQCVVYCRDFSVLDSSARVITS